MADFSDPYEAWKAQGRPGGSFSAWQGGQRPTYENVPGQMPGVPIPQQYPAPQAQTPMAYAGVPNIQQLQQQAAAAGASEDFLRFQQGDIDRWGQFYDAAASARAGRPQFRSSRGQQGFFDKPTECPPGQVPAGGSESDGCRPMSAQEMGGAAFGGNTAQPAAPAAAPGLQQMMAQLPGTPAAPASTGQPLAQAMQPYQSGFQSGTQGLLKQAMAAPKQQGPAAQAPGMGWSAGTDGLAQMMAKRQRQGPQSQGWWV